MAFSKKIVAPQQVDELASVTTPFVHALPITTEADVTFWFDKNVAVRFGATASELSGALQHFPLRGDTVCRFTVNRDSRFMSVKAVGGARCIVSVGGRAEAS